MGRRAGGSHEVARPRPSLISKTSEKFRKCFNRLPGHIQRQAVQAYKDFKRDPSHPGLNFKPTKRNASIYSARVALGWRALGTKRENTIVWFWISSHAQYQLLIAQL